MVLIDKKSKREVYLHLLNEGTIVVKKDTNLPKHPNVNVPNLHVMMMMKTLKSKDYVEETFSWQWAYYILNSKGVKYLRKHLGLPEEVVPATMKKTARPRKEEGEEGYDREERPSRGGYRRQGDEGAEGGQQFSMGRGRGTRPPAGGEGF